MIGRFGVSLRPPVPTDAQHAVAVKTPSMNAKRSASGANAGNVLSHRRKHLMDRQEKLGALAALRNLPWGGLPRPPLKTVLMLSLEQHIKTQRRYRKQARLDIFKTLPRKGFIWRSAEQDNKRHTLPDRTVSKGPEISESMHVSAF